VFIRPFGSIVYLTPAFTVAQEELATLTSAIVKVVGQSASDDKIEK
jgi:adenosylmethionine-8-amino-7-oxononanoate aminotransferase